MNRRNMLKGIGAGVAGFSAGIPALTAAEGEYKIRHQKIRQSVMAWCFKPMPVPELIDHCVEIGMEAIEVLPPEFYPLAVEKGLKISMVKSHNFNEGPTDKKNHANVEKLIIEAIDLAKKFGAPNVMVFSGYVVKDLTAEQMIANCIELWKKVIGHAEKQGVTLCLEQLSTRDTSHPMKGHAGYFVDDFAQCLDMVKTMDSKNFKMLFDFYHISVMNGDLIRRFRDHAKYIGHVHTAGNPGRGELDMLQEIDYASVMQVLVDSGYKGYVGHEFIPTREDKILSLRNACKLCDIG